MTHPYIIKAVAEMRAEPSFSSEVVSQALFSEKVKILDRSGQWIYISTPLDDYKGWVAKESVYERESSLDDLPYVTINRLAAHVYHTADTIYGPVLTLPFESKLTIRKQPESLDSRWIEVITPDGKEGFIQRGDVQTGDASSSSPKKNLKDLCELSKKFLNLPYTWGGRSSFGYDCSGFVQMLLRQIGINLPRDSQQQCDWSNFHEVSLKELEPGDLIFWGWAHDKIRHVGFHLNQGTFIHNSAVTENAPYLRISSLSDKAWDGSGYYPYVCARRLKTTF